MTLTVKQRADHVATFRHVHVAYMETLARWTPAVAEMEAKLLLGRDIWETAQQADLLGKRTAELRARLHFTLTPTAAYSAFLQQLDALQSTPDRLGGFYDIALPGLARRYERFLAATDALMDAPSVVIVQRVLLDLVAMRSRADELRRRLPALAPTSALASLAAQECADVDFVAGRLRSEEVAA